jgi:hypothetical protein
MTFLAENSNYLDHDFSTKGFKSGIILDEPSGNGFVFLFSIDNKSDINMCICLP